MLAVAGSTVPMTTPGVGIRLGEWVTVDALCDESEGPTGILSAGDDL
jgi:hypothetical protein